MAKKALSAPEIPLCINVLRLLNYRLAPDELILFDWLTVKQISFKYKPFHYSQARVEEETRIRRTRQEVIIKQFSALGFLKTDIKVNSVTREQRAKLVYLLKHFTVTVTDFRPIEEAVVTSGGVKTSEIDPKTMQSKLIDGLYFAGEVIDVDAYTGGFNLQIAFSTGHLAGESAAQ